jgi:hypothetical protein
MIDREQSRGVPPLNLTYEEVSLLVTVMHGHLDSYGHDDELNSQLESIREKAQAAKWRAEGYHL